MHHILTHRIECWLPDRGANQPAAFNAEWLRFSVCSHLKNWKKEFEGEKADAGLFHNHAPGKNDPEIRYPLIIYHCIGNTFYITGINAGATALDKLAGLFNSGCFINGGYLLRFAVHHDEQVSLDVGPGLHRYRLRQWLPVTPKENQRFAAMPLTQKAAFMEQKLNMHITADLGKYLETEMQGLKATLDGISFVYPEPVLFKTHRFRAFDVEFSANVALPAFIALGNIKSLGYGRVESI